MNSDSKDPILSSGPNLKERLSEIRENAVSEFLALFGQYFFVFMALGYLLLHQSTKKANAILMVFTVGLILAPSMVRVHLRTRLMQRKIKELGEQAAMKIRHFIDIEESRQLDLDYETAQVRLSQYMQNQTRLKLLGSLEKEKAGWKLKKTWNPITGGSQLEVWLQPQGEATLLFCRCRAWPRRRIIDLGQNHILCLQQIVEMREHLLHENHLPKNSVHEDSVHENF